ncbi:forespore capture DNA-binding protein RefZ [Paenalkalicoccus suaedae]|uniref:forespore capture DNA-binding protein RefZ n=1 Tax=Paenalkalicoccus suaedae TaxID=2592382 RepID=UPI00201BF99F|nr:forespore capture DNA-binding protein RefZ [Paenalkalicoccus suaedae]
MRKTSKEKVLEAAVELFYAKGYANTSVREIASRATVNVALISYHFNGKQGLLETLMTTFFDGYIGALEKECEKVTNSTNSIRSHLESACRSMLLFQQQFDVLSRFVHREMTLDSILVREIMSSYLTKERHLFRYLLEEAFAQGEMITPVNEYMIIQLRGLLTLPFLHSQYIREVHYMVASESYFLDRYFETVRKWLDAHIGEPSIV